MLSGVRGPRTSCCCVGVGAKSCDRALCVPASGKYELGVCEFEVCALGACELGMNDAAVGSRVENLGMACCGPVG